MLINTRNSSLVVVIKLFQNYFRTRLIDGRALIELISLASAATHL